MLITQTDRNQRFDVDGNLIAEEIVEVDITPEVVTIDLHAKARQAIDGNITTLGQIPAAITQMNGIIANNNLVTDDAVDLLAQTTKRILTELERVLKQLTALERLLIGSDLLNDTGGT